MTLQDGHTVIADEAYLRESIRKPSAKIVAGFQPIMPSYKGQVDEEEMIQLIAFIKALRPGQTPRRLRRQRPSQPDWSQCRTEGVPCDKLPRKSP